MTRLLPALVSLALIFAVACGGDDDGGILGGGSGGGATSNDPATFARQALVTFLNVFGGHQEPQRMLDLYTPDCRTNVSAADMQQVLQLVRSFFPEFSKVRVEDIDLGNTKVDRSGDNVTVTVSDPTKIRVKVNGKFIPVQEYLDQVGFDDISDSPFEGVEEPLQLRQVDGKLYIADCDDLEDITQGSSATATPTRSGASPTPQRGTPTPTQTTTGTATPTPRPSTPATGAAGPVVRTTPTAAQRYPAAVQTAFMNACTGQGAGQSVCRCALDIIQVRYNIDQYRELEAAIERNQRQAELTPIIQVCLQ